MPTPKFVAVVAAWIGLAAGFFAAPVEAQAPPSPPTLQQIEELLFGGTTRIGAPIGSILAWHKSLQGTPPLPDGWVECNGQEVTDGNSPYFGRTLPDLNGERRFLRGGGQSGDLESDEVRSHSHAVNTVHDHGYGDFYWRDTGNDPLFSTPTGDASGQRVEDGRTTGPGGGLISSAASGGPETRPVNMSVVWIIRIR